MKVKSTGRYPLGELLVEVDGQEYRVDLDQKPLFYGHPLVVFDDLQGKPGETVSRGVVPSGAHSETLADGANPGHDVVYPLASPDPVLIRITEAWLDGSLPVGKVDLKDFQ